MKILALLSSDVRGGDANIPRQNLFPARMAPLLAEQIGEPVEVTARAIWPTPDLPSLVSRWLAEEAPDFGMFSVQAYWFLYESMPARFARFGAPGRWLSALALKAAATPRLAHNPVFQWGRRALQRMIHGRAHFEPDYVIALSKRCISTILQREGAYLVVVGPAGGQDWATSSGAAVRMERRRKVVDEAIAAFCESHHIEYWSAGMLAQFTTQPRSLQGDRIHLDAEGHRQTALRFLDLAASACRRALAHNAAEESAHTAGARV